MKLAGNRPWPTTELFRLRRRTNAASLAESPLRATVDNDSVFGRKNVDFSNGFRRRNSAEVSSAETCYFDEVRRASDGEGGTLTDCPEYCSTTAMSPGRLFWFGKNL